MSEHEETNPGGELLIYRADEGAAPIRVLLEGETVWLTQKLIAELYGVSIPTVNEHIGHILDDEELQPEATIRKFRIVGAPGPCGNDSAKLNRSTPRFPCLRQPGPRARRVDPMATAKGAWATEGTRVARHAENTCFSRLTNARLASKFLSTSLQFASVAGRRAVPQGAALAYFTGFPMEPEVGR